MHNILDTSADDWYLDLVSHQQRECIDQGTLAGLAVTAHCDWYAV